MTTAIKPYQALLELYLIPEIKEHARPFDEIIGFICAISASPEIRDLADWFPLLSMQEGLSFSNEEVARNFAAAVLHFYEHCLTSYQQSTPLFLPAQSWVNEGNEATAQGSEFASGYLSGFHHIEASWQGLNLAAESEPGQLLQTTVLLLSKMAAGNNEDPQMQALFIQLPTMIKIISTLPSLLSALGNFSVAVSHYE